MVFLLLIAADVLLLQNKYLHASRAIFVIVAATLLTLHSGLRHESIGGRDVFISYKAYFYRSMDTTWLDLWKQLISADTLFGDTTEPGFLLFVKTVSSFTSNYQVMLLVMSLVFMIPFGWLVYRYSADPFISFISYYVVFFSFFSLTGFRQTIATAIAVLLSYPSLTKRRPFKFAGFVALAFLFHRSALIYTLIYPVSATFDPHGKNRWHWALATLFGSFAVTSLATGFLGESFGYSYAYSNQKDDTKTFVTLMCVIFIALALRRKRILESDQRASINLGAVGLGAAFTLLTLVSQSFMRVQQYFSLLLVLALPNFLSSFSARDRLVVRLAITGLSFLLLIYTSPTHLYFWEV